MPISPQILLECYGKNPHRPPDWRWQLAAAHSEIGQAISRSSEAVIIRAKKFCDAYSNLDDEPTLDEVKLRDSDTDLYFAHEIYRLTSDGENMMRDELEARILSGQNPRDIAKRIHHDYGVVKVYEKLFYDIRSRLESPAYACHYLFGRRMHLTGPRGLTDRDPGYLWRLFGWILGPGLLDWMIYRSRAVDVSLEPADLTERIHGAQARLMKIRSFTALQTLNINSSESHALIMEGNAKLRDLERQIAADQGGGSSVAAVDNVRQFITDFEWTIKSATAKQQTLLVTPTFPTLAAPEVPVPA